MIENKIKDILLSRGADICGIASIDRFVDAPAGFSPRDVFSDCRSVIAFGVSMPKGLTKVSSRLIYGHFNEGVCRTVDEIAFHSAKMIEQDHGRIALPLPCDGPYEYWEEANSLGKGLISMKHAAVLCGIGGIGKNTLLLNPQYGNLLTVGAILTDLDLESDVGCDNICIDGCTKCLDACPVNAIENGTVNQQRCRANAYGKTARGFDTVDCNLCRVVCPMRFGRG